MFARRASLFVSLGILIVITDTVLDKAEVMNEHAATILKAIVIGCFAVVGYYHYRKGQTFGSWGDDDKKRRPNYYGDDNNEY